MTKITKVAHIWQRPIPMREGSTTAPEALIRPAQICPRALKFHRRSGLSGGRRVSAPERAGGECGRRPMRAAPASTDTGRPHDRRRYHSPVAKLELTRSLSISPEQAWDHASNLSELGDWLTMHQGWRGEVPAELREGTTLVGVAGAKGMRNRVTWTIRTFDPPQLLKVTGDGVGGTKYALTMSVKPAPDGCSFTVLIDLGGRPLFGPIGAAAARAVKGDIERSIERFEELYG
jgi:uncharacterized protein YndB with AHSA1/START domain